MKTIKRHFVSLEVLAIELHLPQSYLRDLATKKIIPHLDVNGRLRFDPAVVLESLTNLASADDKERKYV